MTPARPVNPYPKDPDRSAIWDIVYRHEVTALAECDWLTTARDFDAAAFFGLDARLAPDPDHWSASIATLDRYRDLWQQQANRLKHLGAIQPGLNLAAGLSQALRVSDIDLVGDRAVAHRKRFGRLASSASPDRPPVLLHDQAIYHFTRRDAGWKIVGMLVNLPDGRPAVASEQSGFHTRLMFDTPPAYTPNKKSGPYSGVLTVEPGRTVAIAGQGPLDADNQIIGQTIEEQTEVTMQNCKRLLEQAGATFADVYKVMVYLGDMEEWGRFNVIYQQHMTPPYPVRTAIGCSLWGGIKVEIDMLARLL